MKVLLTPKMSWLPTQRETCWTTLSWYRDGCVCGEHFTVWTYYLDEGLSIEGYCISCGSNTGSGGGNSMDTLLGKPLEANPLVYKW